MDKELDKNITVLLKEIEAAGKHGAVHDATYQEIASRIHQAYEEAGYRKPSRHEVINERLREKVANGELIRGKEWYERFEKEAKNHIFAGITQDVESMIKDVYLQIAKKAAGLEP